MIETFGPRLFRSSTLTTSAEPTTTPAAPVITVSAKPAGTGGFLSSIICPVIGTLVGGAVGGTAGR